MRGGNRQEPCGRCRRLFLPLRYVLLNQTENFRTKKFGLQTSFSSLTQSLVLQSVSFDKIDLDRIMLHVDPKWHKFVQIHCL